ncbi:MAG: 16S rRNA (guanine(966)-N(2))-methyltransferase RsmD [Bdellovibrionaceae bacterium]|nr:16S rRNA (guanine(966)-N(2))-methyltransferase RsmD [Pseudobdellovibrionaceae bacterium]
MRIIAGKYKGHHLVAFKGDHLRPTTDRVKEALFNKIQFELEDTVVLDLFSGTGNLGLEAISRGAKKVVFVDLNPKSIEILKKNIEKLKVEKARYEIVNLDVFRFLKKVDIQFDFIFIDPPFTQKMAHDVMDALSQTSVFHSETFISIESQKRERMDEAYGSLYRFDFRDYGDKILSYFKQKERPE